MTIGSSSSNHSAGFYIYDADSPLNTNSSGAVDDGPLHQNQVYHLVGTYDSSNKNSFYINGILKSQVSAIGSIQQSPEITTIGGVLNNAGKFFHGSIDDVRIYNRVLSENEVLLYTHSKNTPIPLDGIQLWLDGKDLNGDGNLSNELAMGTKLPAWVDKSGNNRDAEQNTSVDQPIVSSGGWFTF